MNEYNPIVMRCCGDVQKSIFIYTVVQVLQLSGGSDDGSGLSCRLSRTSLHSGFHRTVETVVNLTATSRVLRECNCVILLKELLPSGLYIDTYQTDSLHQHGAAKVFSPTEIDLELPEYLAQPHEIYAYKNTTNFNADDLLQAEFSLPIHLRYHQPRMDVKYLSVSLRPPTIMTHCTCADWLSKQDDLVAAPCSEYTYLSCMWLQLQCTGGQELSFEVLVGQLSHFLLVTTATILVTFTSTAVLVGVMWRTPHGSVEKQM